MCYVHNFAGYFPDIFQLLSLKNDMKSTSTIALTKHSWVIFENVRKNIEYSNNPEHPEQYIYNPPDKVYFMPFLCNVDVI